MNFQRNLSADDSKISSAILDAFLRINFFSFKMFYVKN